MSKKIIYIYLCALCLCPLIVNANELIHKGIKLKYSVEKVPEWTELFRRTSGWTGADGIFSYHDQQSGKNLFVFSDTWIGEVDSKTRERKKWKMINNSMATMSGKQIEFHWNKKGDSSLFVPEQAKGWYWLQDGFIHKSHFYNFPMRIEKDPNGAEGFQFKTAAVDILKVSLKDGLPQSESSQKIDGHLLTKINGHELFYGAGVYREGDFVYVYGRLHKDFVVYLTVARVKVNGVEDRKAWRFWDGKNWNDDIQKSELLGEGGPELSVTKMKSGLLKGKYLLCSMPISRELFVRIGDSPYGPFGPKQVIYTTPDIKEIDGIYTYNAKAHPVLSKEGELLISYNVNATKLNLHKNAEIYRPRFIRIKFED